MKKPTITTLPNGVRVLLVPEANAPTATALVLVGTGSRYEKKGENGLSHFLEHMFFKGTEQYPTTKDIVEVFERVGAISNAFTSTEYTGYYAKGTKAHIPTFLHMLYDMYVHATFPALELEKERGVIIEEINMYEDMPQQKVGELLVQAMFGDQPAGYTIAGPKENIERATRSDIVSYKAKHYHADNTLVIVVGDIDTKVLKKQIAHTFGGITRRKKSNAARVKIDRHTPKVVVHTKKLDQAHIALGFHGVSFGHADARVYTLLATILGRGLSSRLAQKLREELGAAYYVGAGNDMHSSYGVFEIAAGIDKRRLDEILVCIRDILIDLKHHLVRQEELAKACEYTIGTMQLGLESSDEIAGFYGAQLMMTGELLTPQELQRAYRSVTAEDIRRVARSLFVAGNTTLAVVGPYTEKDVSIDPFLAL